MKERQIGNAQGGSGRPFPIVFMPLDSILRAIVHFIIDQLQDCSVLDQQTKRTGVGASNPQDRDHWIAKVVFALMMAALVGAQLAMQLGVPLLPDNWP